jgi:hypothetical protein
MGCTSSSRDRLQPIRPGKASQVTAGNGDRAKEMNRREQDTATSITETGSFHSHSTSVRSLVSGVTSFQSMHSSKYHISRKSSALGDDMMSEVPTIAESIADMGDLEDLPSSGPSSVIDNRQHPLAPVSSITNSHMDGPRIDAGFSDNSSATSSEIHVRLRPNHMQLRQATSRSRSPAVPGRGSPSNLRGASVSPVSSAPVGHVGNEKKRKLWKWRSDQPRPSVVHETGPFTADSVKPVEPVAASWVDQQRTKLQERASASSGSAVDGDLNDGKFLQGPLTPPLRPLTPPLRTSTES